MDRTRFLKTVGVAAGLAVLLTLTPAVADHVSEPTAPIELERVDVYPYPNFADRLIAKDGSETVDWSQIRIEPRVRFENKADKLAGGASEHFSVRITVSKVFEIGSQRTSIRAMWGAEWSHQNVPPHKPQGGTWEVSQSNSYDLQSHLGLWQVDTKVAGDKSGNTFEDVILFRVEAPGGEPPPTTTTVPPTTTTTVPPTTTSTVPTSVDPRCEVDNPRPRCQTTTVTTVPTTTTTVPGSPLGASIGVVGCSNTEDAVENRGGYLTQSSKDLLASSASGGGSLARWDSNSRGHWAIYDSMRPSQGYSSVWWMLCVRTGEGSGTYEEQMDSVLAQILERDPGATVLVSWLNSYTFATCPQVDWAVEDQLLDYAVSLGLAVGPELGPLNEGQVRRDDCHPNSAGSLVLGGQLVDFFD